jgi:plastocyanin
VSCNGSEIETQSEVLIDPDGVVYDINTGAPLSAAQAVCMVQSNGNEGATDGSAVSDNYSVWPAANFGQLNPQTTKSDGYFSFFTPAGTYRLDVNKSGYQPYRSPNLQVVSTPVRHDVPLTPNIIEKPKVTITINENGFEPAMVRVAPGTAIAFVNADTRDHSAQGKLKSSAQAIETGGFNSGMLGPNQSHVVKLSEVGTYLFNDSANPEASGTIVVEGAFGYRVLLPLVRK